MDKEIRYRVFYKSNAKSIKFDGFWYSDAFLDFDYAEEYLNNISEKKDFSEGHIKEEVTTKRIIKSISK